MIIPKAGVWKKVFMTPKVLILLIITFTLFSFTFSYNTKSKRKKLKSQREKREKRNSIETPISNKDSKLEEDKKSIKKDKEE